ncbi:MAG: O-antigen ligase family protein [Phycisphaerales bacterium]|nr:MAG: O-antigen ligase family protein [Phycisphaerales bacterium]
MFEQVDTLAWLILIVAAVVAHVVLVILARYANVMALLTGAFVVLSLASTAKDVPYLDLLRLARTYCAILAVGVGILHLRLLKFQAASMIYFAFILFYVIAGTWSDDPTSAMLRKTIYAGPMFMGILLAYSIRSRRDLDISIRVLAISAAILAVFLLIPFLRDFGAANRLGPWGINPNRLGTVAGSMTLICVYVALYDSSRIWKVVSWAAASAFCMMILYTGSRSAVVYTLLGCFVIAMPLMRRPLALALLVLAVLGTGWFLQDVMVPTRATERLTEEASLTGRDVIWAEGMAMYSESPLIGAGWATERQIGGGLADTINLHNIYVQALAETGLVGLSLLLLALIIASVYALVALRGLRGVREFQPGLYFAGGAFGAALAHGLVASSALSGSNIPAVLLPFCIGLFERLPMLARSEETRLEEEPLDSWDAAGLAEYGVDLYQPDSQVNAVS